ncbi:hypothetical protein BRADI_1g68395v3, partial [Brachypodium distachyon]
MPVYPMMSLDLPGKIIKGVEKICRGFLWKGQKEAKGGHCLVAWDSVCLPKQLGGLGIPNLHPLNLALRARWRWLERRDDSKPWRGLALDTPKEVDDIFEAATSSIMGDGRSTRFWTDRWLGEERIRDSFLALTAAVRPRLVRQRTVREVLDGACIEDVGPNLGENALAEFLLLWERVQGFRLDGTVADTLRWNWSNDGVYSAKSAYLNLLAGRALDPYATEIWHSRAPLKCRVFAWLAARNRCWTADRLAKRGLPHPDRCPLCDQEEESISHLLLGCVLARQVWDTLFSAWGHRECVPSAGACLRDWWSTLSFQRRARKDFRTATTLVLWTIWCHRNDVVFNGASPSVQKMLFIILEELGRWENAGLLR